MTTLLHRSWLPRLSKRASRRRSSACLGIEYLEERLAPAGLPADIVVGRTLSAYFVGAVQNHQETITYTVYNEQAESITCVLLTDTLQPGVAIATASQVPDQNGQNLAWSLGTIQGFDRASITLTVTLPSTIPLQLDAGAQAFATLDAGAVTNSTPAATLMPGNVGDPSLLASTPDANTMDPYVQEEAAKLNYDPAQIFNFLENDIGYNSYLGSLRGARGTLWSNAGNALDVSSLGVALMRASGIPAQYISGTLTPSQAQELILSMFLASFQTVGSIPAGTPTADPANDPQLLAETESHYWFQFDAGSGMTDADPLMAAVTSGGGVGQIYTARTGTFGEVADSLRSKTEVSLTAEIYNQASAAFGLASPFQDTVVLDQTFNDVDLVGRPLTIGNFVSQSGSGFILSARTNTYTPYLVVGDEALSEDQLPEAIIGQQYQEVMTNFPLGNQLLTGLFLHITLSGPGSAAQSFDRALVDRIGYAARNGFTGANVSVDPNGPPAITPYDLTTLNILPSLQSSAAAHLAQERATQELANIRSETNPSQLSEAESLTVFARAELASYAALSDQLTVDFAAEFSLAAYFNTPRITAFSSRVDTRNEQSSISFSFDLINDSIHTLGAPGNNLQSLPAFAASRGALDSVLESQSLPNSSGGQNLSAATIVQTSVQQSIPLMLITPGNLATLPSLDLPDDAIARITANIQEGLFVIVPARALTVNGNQMTAWYDYNPTTGELLAQSQSGQNQGIIGYIAIGIGLFSIASLAIDAENYAYDLTTGNQILPKDLKSTSRALLNLIGAVMKLAAFEIKIVFAIFSLANAGTSFAGRLDPPLPSATLDMDLPSLALSAHQATTSVVIPDSSSTGPIQGSLSVRSVSLSKRISASWSSTAISSFQATALSASGTIISSSSGQMIGAGLTSLTVNSAVPVDISGNNSYSVSGTGNLSFYGPAESSLGVGGNWTNYSANVNGNVSITLTVPDGVLSLNGTPLPAGTYTITTNSATLAGSGNTSSPNFSGSASITATNGTVNLGPGSGSVTVGGNPLDATSGATLTGYTGSIAVAAGGGGNDDVTLNGNATNVLTVAASPAMFTTDQNTSITFPLSVNTSFADTYNLTATAPPGWTVTIDNTGNVTATPAPGLQSGTYPIQIIAQSTTNPDLVAQTIVNVTITPTAPGINFNVNPDSIFTVPFNGAQIPSAFQAKIQNLGPAAATYNLTFSNVPTGFTLLNTGTSVTVPAGQTGILGLYLQPNVGQTIPPPGTVLSFTVTATSTTDPAITQSQVVTFTVPAIDAVTVTSNPVALNTTPGAAATDVLTITNVGNVVENNIALASTTSSGLTLTGLTPLSLAIGQSATETITVTPDASTPLNSQLQATITATFGASNATQTLQLPVDVVVPGAQAIATAAAAAGQLGDTNLANRLNDLSTALTNLVQNPTSAVYSSQAQASLSAVIGLLSADAFLSALAPALTSDGAALAQATTASDVQAAVVDLGNDLTALGTTLADEAAHGFTLNLAPNSAVILPSKPADFGLVLQNIGTQATTYDLGVAGLPANVSAVFLQNGTAITSVALAPGETLGSGVNGITLELTETGGSLFPTGFTVSATAEGAPEIVESATGTITVRAAVVEVTEVDATPPYTKPGSPIDVTAKVLNSVNQQQQALASYTVTDPSGTVVFTSTPVALTLNVQTSLTSIDLGNVDTTGFANGSDTIAVTVTDNSGTTLATGTGTLLIGSPVTATLTTSPQTVPSGNAIVTTTLSVQSLGATGDLLTLTGQVQTSPTSLSIALKGSLAYVAGTNGIDVVDVSDPAHPEVLNTFGQSQIVQGGTTVIRMVGANTLVVGSAPLLNPNGTILLLYDLSSDPTHPSLVSNTLIPYALISDLEVQGNTVLITTVGSLFPGGSLIQSQFGDIVTVDVSDPLNPVVEHAVENTTQPYSGTTFKNDAQIVTPTTAYVAGTTVTGSDTQTGIGRVLVVDITDPAATFVVNQIAIPGTVQILGIAIQGNRALVVGTNGGLQNPFTSSNYGFTGHLTLSVLDITDPRNPKLLGTTLVTGETFPLGFVSGKLSVLPLGNGEYAVSFSLQNGAPDLLLVAASDPSNIATEPIAAPASINEMAVSGNLLYAVSAAGLFVYTIHISPPAFSVIGQVALPGIGTTDGAGIPVGGGVALNGNLLYASASDGIRVYDVTNPASPQLLNTVGQSASVLRIDGNELIALHGVTSFVVSVYSLSDPTDPQLLGSTPSIFYYNLSQEMIVTGTHVFVPVQQVVFFTGNHDIFVQDGDLISVDISNPAAPVMDGVLFNTHGTDNDGIDAGNGYDQSGGNFLMWSAVQVDPTTLLVASTTATGGDTQDGIGRIDVVDISDPTHMTIVGHLDIPGTVQVTGLQLVGNQVLVTASTGGYQQNFTNNNYDLTGEVVLATVDVTAPRDPQLLHTQVVNRASRSDAVSQSRFASLGNGLYAFSNLGASTDQPELQVINAADPQDFGTSGTVVPSDIVDMTGDSNVIYTTSADGLIIYQVAAPPPDLVTAEVEMPKNTVVAGTFNIAPTRIDTSDPNFDTLEWDLSLPGGDSQTLTWNSAVTGLQAGQTQTVADGATINFTSQGTPGTVTLPSTKVTGAQILGLSPATQTAAPASSASYTVTVTNPTSSSDTFNLAVLGVPSGWVSLPANVTVAANSSVNETLTLTSAAFAALSDYGFTVTAKDFNGAEASVSGDFILAGQPPTPDPEAHGVVVSLTPSTAIAGQGTSVVYTVQVTNTGSATELFDLGSALPTGIDGFFSAASVLVPPGASNFRDVTLTLTPQVGSAPGNDSFIVNAASTTSSATSAANGALLVVSNGVSVALDKSSGAPGDTFIATITNTGTVTDTFDLSIAGPASLVASLGMNKVTLGPGASQTINVATNGVNFAVQGALKLIVAARSEGNPEVVSSAAASLTIAPSVGLTASLNPGVRVIPIPGTADFELLVNNTGNSEDAYTATITGISGPLTASLDGLDGQPTQTIPTFRLPGLSTGEILIHTDLTAGGAGTVQVQVQSQSDPSRLAAVTAVVSTSTPLTLTSDNSSPSFGQSVTFTATVPTISGLGMPTGTITFMDGATALGSSTLVNGTATLITTALSAGTHSVTASYSGDSSYSTGVSPPVAETVQAAREGKGQIYAVGAGPGGGPRVQVFNAVTNAKVLDFFAYDSTQRGGVSVATGDATGTGIEDVITGAGLGGGPEVEVFNGQTGVLIASWFAYDPSFRGGVWVAAEDLYGDGKSEIVTGPGIGGGPVVKVWTLTNGTPTLVSSFYAYEPEFRGGVTVATGLAPSGAPVIVVGAGPGGGPRVRTFEAVSLQLLSDVYAFEPTFTGGVYVASGDVLGTGEGTEILVGPGPGGGPRLRVLGTDGTEEADAFAAVGTLRNGLTVAAVDQSTGPAEVLIGAGQGAYEGFFMDGSLDGLQPVGFFEARFTGGVFVG